MDFLYHQPTWVVAFVVVLAAIACAALIFESTRPLVAHFKYPNAHEAGSINEAITGVVGAIGVFFGITIGLIAIDVWQRHASAKEIAAREAAVIQTLYLSTSSLKPDGATPVTVTTQADALAEGQRNRTEAAQAVANYLGNVICLTWRYQNRGIKERWPQADVGALRAVREQVARFDPESKGAEARYAEAIRVLDQLTELRRMRADAADEKMAGAMWGIILVGSAVTIFVVCLFKLDRKPHLYLVISLSGLLGLLILIIVMNDRPFLGSSGIEPDSYTELGWIITGGQNPFSDEEKVGWVAVCENKLKLKPNFAK